MRRIGIWLRCMWIGVKWTASGKCANGTFSRWTIFRTAFRFARVAATDPDVKKEWM